MCHNDADSFLTKLLLIWLSLFSIVLAYFDTVLVKLEGQRHKLKFKLTAEEDKSSATARMADWG